LNSCPGDPAYPGLVPVRALDWPAAAKPIDGVGTRLAPPRERIPYRSGTHPDSANVGAPYRICALERGYAGSLNRRHLSYYESGNWPLITSTLDQQELEQANRRYPLGAESHHRASAVAATVSRPDRNRLGSREFAAWGSAAVKEKKDRVDDAVHATKAAVEEGIVAGGGVALLRAKAAIGKLSDENADIQSGINLVLRAIEAPIRQIVENAGVEGSLVVGKILENKSQTFGFNAQTEQYVDMLSAGIVDPAKACGSPSKTQRRLPAS
jgi:TCP-1/cpn60 chaperonin family